jgi:hypothetical protein
VGSDVSTEQTQRNAVRKGIRFAGMQICGPIIIERSADLSRNWLPAAYADPSFVRPGM